MKITFCIPSKNNLRYLKSSINSIKNNSSADHDIIVYVDSDNDGTEKWLIDNNIKYLVNESHIPKGIAYAYNRCIELANTEIVCMFHADMYMAKHFDTNIVKYIKPKTVVAGTRIEPPLHPSGLEKIVENFGTYPEDFDQNSFDDYVDKLLVENKGKITRGIFAPWAVYKKDIVDIEMHDESFHSYHEDSDMFNRFILNGYEMIQTWESYVYHLTCRGGQFQDGIEKTTQDPFFHNMKNNSAKNYLRKWGSWIKNDEYQHPIIPSKYSIAFVVNNCSEQALSVLEPWCSEISSDVNYSEFLKNEQQNTHFDLMKRVKPWNCKIDSDIIVQFDVNGLTNQSFQLLQQLPQIIKESGEVGEFELNIFKIKIKKLRPYEDSLINATDEFYISQML
jgi:glycosyltransferase involved in cell wall biosynthesis